MMKKITVICCIVVLLFVSCSKKEASNHPLEEENPIKGTWVLQSEVENNKTITPSDCQKKSHIVLSENQYVEYHYATSKRNRCVIKKIDTLGYSLSGNRIKLSTEDTFIYLIRDNYLTIISENSTSKITKVYKKSPNTIDISKDFDTDEPEEPQPPHKDVAKFIGNWYLSSFIFNGKEQPLDACAQKDEAFFTDKEIVFRLGRETAETKECILVPSDTYSYALNDNEIIIRDINNQELMKATFVIDETTLQFVQKQGADTKITVYKKGYNPINKNKDLIGKWTIQSYTKADGNEEQLTECDKKGYVEVTEAQWLFVPYKEENDECKKAPLAPLEYYVVGNKVYTFSGVTFSYKLVDNNTLNVYIQNTVSVYKKN